MSANTYLSILFIILGIVFVLSALYATAYFAVVQYLRLLNDRLCVLSLASPENEQDCYSAMSLITNMTSIFQESFLVGVYFDYGFHRSHSTKPTGASKRPRTVNSEIQWIEMKAMTVFLLFLPFYSLRLARHLLSMGKTPFAYSQRKEILTNFSE